MVSPRKLSIAIACALVACSSFALMAQVQPIPTAQQILERYVQALGGRARILKISTRTMSGTFHVNGTEQGTVEVVYKTPARYRSIATITGYGVIDQGHDAAGGWEKSPDQPLSSQSGVELARTRRELDLHKAAKLAQLYRSLTVTGRGKDGDRDAWLVVATPAEGSPETMYFDTETGLLVRVDLQVTTEGGPASISRHYDDYLDVGGVKVAHTIRFMNPGNSYTLKFINVQHNVEVPESKLVRPAN